MKKPESQQYINIIYVSISARNYPRLGIMCVSENKCSRKPINSHSPIHFVRDGPILKFFPKMRNLKGVSNEILKNHLEKFLKFVPDQLSFDRYCMAAESNSIDIQLHYWINRKMIPEETTPVPGNP